MIFYVHRLKLGVVTMLQLFFIFRPNYAIFNNSLKKQFGLMLSPKSFFFIDIAQESYICYFVS